MPVKEKLQTRLAVGRSGVLRVETPEEDIVEVLQRGVKASYDAELRRFILRPDLTRAPKGRKCRFHRYPNGVHHLSVPISPTELELIEPFRIVPVRNWSIEDDGDEEMVVLTMPDNLKLPKGYVGYTRTPDLPRDAKPLSHAVVEELEALAKPAPAPFDPTLLSRLITLTKDYAWSHDITLCLDADGEIYGRIG